MDSDVPAMIASVSGTLSRTETITAEQAAEPVRIFYNYYPVSLNVRNFPRPVICLFTLKDIMLRFIAAHN